MNILKKASAIIFLTLVASLNLSAQKGGPGKISGVIIEKSSGIPLEFANIFLKKESDSTLVQGLVSGKKGEFAFGNLANGRYILSYSFIGFETKQLPVIAIDTKQTKVDLGKLYISESNSTLGEVDVTGRKSTFVNSIDRKTFNVGEDLMSKTGTVSELLQNVPSVQVDMDGNLSLRGSDNVMVLINGKPSALMAGSNRGAILQQMPANSIEKIEIITNPSAKYKPDGTSGIINIVLKKNKSMGLNGSMAINTGNDERYNGNVMVSYNPGKINIFGSYSIRQDDRLRFTDDYRKRTKLKSDTITTMYLNSHEHARPLSNIVNTGIDYKINDHNKIGITGNYNHRFFDRRTTDVNKWQDNNLQLIKDYDRLRRDPEVQKEMELTTNYQHTFAREGHEMNIDYTVSRSREQEDNHYTDIYRIPALSPTYDNTLIKQGDDQSQFSVEFTNPISENRKFESGYILESRTNDMDFFGESLDNQTSQWNKDFLKTNHFVYDEVIHVGYATYEQDFGKLGFLAGVRAEQSYLKANQVTTDTLIRNQYFRLYPSLHLSYKLTKGHELQLNYSHRIRRPEGEQMNPFPEYQDPYNLRVGNPRLKPADIHSIEFGYQFKNKNTTFLSTLYYRYTYNSITDITYFKNDSVKVSTAENLSKSRSAGLELVIAQGFGRFGNVNLSTNTYYNTIDASALGYSSNKSAFAWSANLSSGINLSKSTVLQITSSYLAQRLTPQGKQLPSFVLNTGFKQEFLKKKMAFIVTVSDALNSMRNTTIIDTPELYEKVIRKRSARMVYAGFFYSIGKPNKKDNSLKFDNQL